MGEFGRVAEAVEKLVLDLHQDKDQLVRCFLDDFRSQELLLALCKCLASGEPRLCSHVAYVLGTIAENETGAQSLVAVGQSQTSASHGLLHDLNAMLKWSDAEAVMNAAGTLGTMAETSNGRQWLLNDSDFKGIVDNVTALLDSPNEWTASNAALVLARISLCEDGCRKLLEQPNSQHTLSKLIASLGVDEAGCGMHAAFALGRFCDLDIGRKRILNMKEAPIAIETLEKMMASGDTGGSRNACFALSCLATDREGHSHILTNQVFPEVLDTLCGLVESEEQESAWFAAMTLKVLASQPSGVVKLRAHPKLTALLKTVACSLTAGKDLLEEVNVTLRKLLPLSKPTPPRAEVPNTNSIRITWSKVVPESGLEITYRLLNGDQVLYEGSGRDCLLSDVKRGEKYAFRLHVSTEGDAGHCSDVTAFTAVGSVSSQPLRLRLVGCTPTQVKLGWNPPAQSNGVIKYYLVQKGEQAIETTSQLTCIVSGLTPSTSYEFGVCAVTSRGRGERALLSARTDCPGDHAPSKLAVTVLGRNEMFITWDVPQVPLGRLFNFELCLNGQVVYMGPERSFTARRLAANTEHSCSVSAITSEGRSQSRTVTKKTAKDEYGKTSRYFYSFSRTNHSLPLTSTKGPAEARERLRRSKTQVCVQREQYPFKGSKASLMLTKGAQKGTHKQCENDTMPSPATQRKRVSLRSSLTDSSEFSSDCNEFLSPEAVKPNATLIQDPKMADARQCVGASLNENSRENLETKAVLPTVRAMDGSQLSLQGKDTKPQLKTSCDASARLEKQSRSQRVRNILSCARAARVVMCGEIYDINAQLQVLKPALVPEGCAKAETQLVRRDWWRNRAEWSPKRKVLRCKKDTVQQPETSQDHSYCWFQAVPIARAGCAHLDRNTPTQSVKEGGDRLQRHIAIADFVPVSKRPLLPKLNRRMSSTKRLQSTTNSTSFCGNWQDLCHRDRPEPTKELAVGMGVNCTARRGGKPLRRSVSVLPNPGQNAASASERRSTRFQIDSEIPNRFSLSTGGDNL
ncbi:uncharacterized protein LOC103183109 [Callorhinchus milii]|uniref:uncharacterized protein LOC103183109 n=1 Tax=Callorhinchus milii TaxID=7868 RepID=UPI001C3F9A7C|nr:uncharacterized protein LOC103183109 [Callorhinchus milii]